MLGDMVYNEIINIIESDLKDLHLHCAGSEMLLLALVKLKDSMTSLIFKEMNITVDDIKEIIKNYYFLRKDTFYTYKFDEIVTNAKRLMVEKDFAYDEAYLYSLLQVKDTVAKDIIKKMGVEENLIYEELEHAQEYLEKDSKILVNMSKLAKEKKLNPFIGRKHYIDKVDRILSRKQKNNPMLIGAAGVGKTGIVEGLVQHYLITKPHLVIYRLDLSIIIAGTRYRGDLEERLLDAIEEIKDAKAIVFIDEIHNIVAANSNEASLDIANILKPVLSRSEIKCIGATTTEEYYRYVDKDKALVRRFQNVFVEEVDDEECLEILRGIKGIYEDFYNLIYPDEILKYIIVTAKIMTNRRLPDKAIDLMDESGIISKRQGLKEVNKKIIDNLVFENIGLDRDLTLKNANKRLNYPSLRPFYLRYLNLESENLIASIQGGDLKLILDDIKKVFKVKNEMILEIDMNDFLDNHFASNLIGAPSGYVGYEHGGILTEHLIKYPFAVIIFKNFDTAHPLIKDIIKRGIKNGTITDNRGRILSLKNSLFIFDNCPKRGTLGFITKASKEKEDDFIDIYLH